MARADTFRVVQEMWKGLHGSVPELARSCLSACLIRLMWPTCYAGPFAGAPGV